MRKVGDREQKRNNWPQPKGVNAPFCSDPHELCCREECMGVDGRPVEERGEPRTFHVAAGQQGASESLILKTRGGKCSLSAPELQPRGCEGVITAVPGQRTAVYLVVLQGPGIEGPAQEKFGDHTSQGPHVYGFTKR